MLDVTDNDLPTISGDDKNAHLIFAALRQQGYSIKMRSQELYTVSKGHQKKLIMPTSLFLNAIHVPYFTLHKHITKRLLQEAGATTPAGNLVTTQLACQRSVKQLRRNCVIKPNSSGFGQAVTVLPKTTKQVQRAFQLASTEDPNGEVVVEHYISGQDLRILTLNGKLLAALHRQRANVTGDGKHTIAELITRKNKLRFNKKLPLINPVAAAAYLPALTLQEKPVKDQVIFLLPNNNISTGGDSYGVTDEVHPSYRSLIKKLCRVLDLNCVGFDFLVQDWHKPYNPSTDYIIEINSCPDIYIHHYVWAGKPQVVATQIARAILQSH